jgi:hypothetical protein
VQPPPDTDDTDTVDDTTMFASTKQSPIAVGLTDNVTVPVPRAVDFSVPTAVIKLTT